MRRAARTDSNHTAILAAARQLGCLVLSLAAVGRGCPDLLICLPKRLGRRLLLCEVKDGAKVPSKQKLTPEQVEFHAEWPVTVVRSVEDLLALLKAL